MEIAEWLSMFDSQKNSSKRKGEVPPLEATVLEISATGNLTIIFNRPIILPLIEVRNSTNSTARDLRQ